MLRQIERRVQNRPTTKNGVFPVTGLFLFFNFVSYKNILERVSLMYQLSKRLYSYYLLALESNLRVLYTRKYP